jgi:glucose/arabinose dehydrogenase
VTGFRLTAAALALVACAACSKSTTPPPPPATTPTGPATVTGRENLGWTQSAGSLAEVGTIGFYVYIDGQKQSYDGATCQDSGTSGSFTCQAPLPKMNPGARTLQLTSYYRSAPGTESVLSDSLQVVVQGIVAGAADAVMGVAQRSATAPSTTATANAWPAGLVRIADGLERPSDIAFTPDARLWIAERSGRVRVVRDGQIAAEPALTLDPRIESVVSLTADPQFAATHFMYAIYTERSRSGRTFAIARFRESANTLADRIVLLDNVLASADARATLRFGLDGKLYAAFDDGGDARLAADPATFNGKVLRLNPDGTTPDDAPRKSPILMEGPSSPRGLAWHRPTSRLWAADTFAVGGLRWTVSPESIAVRRDDLFVASETGLALAQIQRSESPQLAGLHDVVRNLAIRAVATAPDGTVYVVTDTAVARLQ